MADTLLTISQTADYLGVSERTLRRALQAPDLLAKLVVTTRHIGGRERHVSLVNEQLMSDLRQRYFGIIPQAIQQASPGELPEALRVVYERLIDEKTQRIADLQSALDHERRQSQRLAQALLEAQSVRPQSNNPVHRSLMMRFFGGRNGLDDG